MSYVLATLFILFLIIFSGVVARRQIHILRTLKSQEQLPREDRRYFRWQCYRRLIGCGLQLLLAGLLGGLFYAGIINEIDRIRDLGDQVDQGIQLTKEEMAFVWFAFSYVLAIILVILLWLAIAVVEMMAIRRYGMRHRRRIRNDREDMLQRQLPLIRRGRNGPQ